MTGRMKGITARIGEWTDGPGRPPAPACAPEEAELLRETSRLKAECRREARARLERLTGAQKAASDERITEFLLSSAWFREARSVFLYLSVGREPDTAQILKRALAEGKTVLAPRCGERPFMKAVRVSSADALRPGAFGIPEPPDGPDEGAQADLVIMPCLAVDREGWRLGHGGGYYDAFLSQHPARSVCLCHAALLLDRLPHDARDVRPDACILSDGWLYPQNGGPDTKQKSNP